MKIVRKKYSEWDNDIQRRLRYATLPEGYLRRYIRVAPNSLTLVAFSQRQIMGWVFVLSVGGENDVNIYVNKRYRKNGLATHLIEQTLEIYPEIILIQWNDITKKLFRRLQKQHPKQIKVIDWHKNIEKYKQIILSLESGPFL